MIISLYFDSFIYENMREYHLAGLDSSGTSGET